MDKKYLLPTLSKEETVKSDDCWVKMDRIYDFLLDNLKLQYEPKDSVFDEKSSSLPHIFEQMILFNRAFLDKKDSDHNRAVLEWRAVLAIMALQRIANIKLDMIKIEFEENRNVFVKAVESFLPNDKPVFFNTTWDILYVLCLEDIPIAILSPITIVCPAKMFKLRIEKRQEWMKIRKVNGREELKFDFYGKGNEFTNLTRWLKQLEHNLSCSNLEDSEICNRFDIIKKELKKYIDEIAKEGNPDMDTLFRKDIYDTMNNSIREEYHFLNNCCDFRITNPNMEFLVERYQNNIFQDKLMVITYDERPDSMFNRENQKKLDALFSNVTELNNERIIAVRELGGTQMAAYTLIPFKSDFITELLEHRITPEEFFEKYTVTYKIKEQVLEIVLQIKEFPYAFRKSYKKDDWQMLYGNELTEVFIWPPAQVNRNSWKAYYTYVSKKNSTLEVDLPTSEEMQMISPKAVNGRGDFQIIRSTCFPNYLQCKYKHITGYLPLKAGSVETEYAGSTIKVFVDIGHTTTSLMMVKEYTEKKVRAERVPFRLPHSLRVMGNLEEDNESLCNFVIPNSISYEENGKYFKNMIHSFQKYQRTPENGIINIFQNGQVLFGEEYCKDAIENEIISFINFQYKEMDFYEREHVHLFIRQILLYAIHEAAKRQCSYIEICFLHDYEDCKNKHFLHNYKKRNKLGEIERLWEHTLFKIKNLAGMKKSRKKAIREMPECEALSYYLYHKLLKEHKEGTSDLEFSSKEIYVCVDIGWSKTIMTHINRKNSKDTSLTAMYTKIPYAGREISMISQELSFKQYPNMLSILLQGTPDIDNAGEYGKILEEFKTFYEGEQPKDLEYYRGLFDVIAMKIEKENFVKPSDVYNNKQEFKAFLEMLTYNVLLLFYNIGYMIGKMQNKVPVTGDVENDSGPEAVISEICAQAAATEEDGINSELEATISETCAQTVATEEVETESETGAWALKEVVTNSDTILETCNNMEKKHIHIYLGGNGAKFLKWITNLKNFSKIDEQNERKILVIEMETTILDVIKQGYWLQMNEDVSCTIILEENGKEQLLEGAIFKENPEIFSKISSVPEILCEQEKNRLDKTIADAFFDQMKEIRTSVFHEKLLPEIAEVTQLEQVEKTDIGEIISTDSNTVCRKIIDEVNHM